MLLNPFFKLLDKLSKHDFSWEIYKTVISHVYQHLRLLETVKYFTAILKRQTPNSLSYQALDLFTCSLMDSLTSRVTIC